MSGSYNDILREHWDRLNGGSAAGGDSEFKLRPFFSINRDSETELATWLVETLMVLQDEQESRARTQLNNINFYNGIQALEGDKAIRFQDRDQKDIPLEARWVMNHIRDFTQQKHSRITRFSPDVNVFPWNNEYSDRLGARLGKRIIDSTFYQHNFKDISSDIVREAIICGESFLFAEWDPNAGDKDTAVERAKMYQDTLGEDGAEIFVNKDGAKINLDVIARIGDHKFDHPLPFLVLHEPCVRWCDVNYIFKGTVKHIDQIRAENRGMSSDKLESITRFDGTLGENKLPSFEFGDYVIEWEFYHRGTELVDAGYYCRFVGDQILKSGDLPYSHRELPVIRFTDYDDVLTAHGKSFYEDLKLPSVMINNMMKIAYRSFAIAAYPKLIMPENSCNMYSMANGPFVVEYKPGMTPPQIVSFNAVNKDFFPLSEHVERFMEKSSGTFGISRGETVPNARARSILSFYEEQEEQRESSQIAKWSAFIEKLAKQILGNSGDFYKPEDGRTLRIVGKTNRFKVYKLKDTTKLSSSYDVKVERTTAMSESKQGRIDQIATLSGMPLAENEGQPGLFTREQILQMIEVADTPTFFEMATAAAERSASENEDLFEGSPVPLPTREQAHLVDWNQHFQFCQSREFTDTQGVPPQVREAFLEHLQLHEQFMFEQATRSVTFAQTLAQNPYYPCVYELPIPLTAVLMAHQQGMAIPLLPIPGVADPIPVMAPPAMPGEAPSGEEAAPPEEADPGAQEQEEPPVEEEAMAEGPPPQPMM